MRECIELTDFAVVSATGADARSFLQGYLTCDLDALSPNHALIGALCNLQGRVITDVLVAEHHDGLLLCMHGSTTDLFVGTLTKYLVFSKTRLITEAEWAAVGCFEPGEAPLTVSPTHAGIGVSLADGSRQLLMVPRAEAEGIVKRHDAAAARAWAAADVACRWVHVTASISGKFLPQMLGYAELGAISFSKGCYLGQEIVARAQHRGEVKRRLTTAHWSGIAPMVGDAVADAAGNQIATLVTVAGGPTSGTALAVGMARRGTTGRTAGGATIAF